LVVAEVALGMVLAASTGLMMRSLANALATDVGFDSENVLTAELSLPESEGDPPVATDLEFRRLLDGLSALPGVESVGSVSHLPLNHETFSVPYTTSDGLDVPVEDRPTSLTSRAGPGYFETMGIPLLAGRVFEFGSNEDGAVEVVVSQGLADRLWPGESGVGRTVLYGRSENPVTGMVMGVVGDTYYDGLTDGPQPHLYRPLIGSAARRRFLVVAAAPGRSPASLVEPVRDALFRMAPETPAGIRPMTDIVRESTGLWAISSLFLGMFGLVALGLAALGIYGVVAFSVAQRRKEMGLRLALGAGRRRILRTVVGEGLSVTAVGLSIGAVGALGAGALLSNLLLGVGSMDIPTLLGVTSVFVVVAGLSAALPARRAAAVEPSEALRQE
jgi:predicted permease